MKVCSQWANEKASHFLVLSSIIFVFLLRPPVLANASDLSIGNYSLQGQKRVARTIYDYTYSATVTNHGSKDATNVSASVSSFAAGTTVIDGSLVFGDVPALSVVQSGDTFTIRVDRLYPFSETSLNWDVQYTIPLADGFGVVGRDGGSVSITDTENRLYGSTVVVPPQGLSVDTLISIQEGPFSSHPREGFVSAGPMVSFGPDGTVFNDEVYITIPYDDDENDGIIDFTDIPEDQVVPIWFNTLTREWETLAIHSQDVTRNTVTVKANHFSIYGTMCPLPVAKSNVKILTIDGLEFKKTVDAVPQPILEWVVTQVVTEENLLALGMPSYLAEATETLNKALLAAFENSISALRPSYLYYAILENGNDLQLNRGNVISYGGPGSAASGESWDGNAETTKDIMPDLLLKLDEVSRDPLIIVSHSWGTVLAQIALAKRPDIRPELLITLSSPLGTENLPFSPEFSPIRELLKQIITLYTHHVVSSILSEHELQELEIEHVNHWTEGDIISGPLSPRVNLKDVSFVGRVTPECGIDLDVQSDREVLRELIAHIVIPFYSQYNIELPIVDSTLKAIVKEINNVRVWHRVTSLSREKMRGYKGFDVYECYGQEFIALVMEDLRDTLARVSGLDYGLVAHYPFNGNALDESGNGNHGLVHGATPTHDRFGNPNSAYYFDGWQNRVEVPNSPSIGFSHQPISISCWIKADPVQYHNGAIVSKRRGVEPDPGFVLYQRGHVHVVPVFDRGKVAFDLLYLGGSDHTGRIATEAISYTQTTDSQWHHIVATYDGSYMKMYIDGVLEDVVPYTGGFDNHTSPMYIGSMWYSYYDGYEGRNWWSFHGAIDDVRIYNRGLSPTEVAALMSSGGYFAGRSLLPDTGQDLCYNNTTVIECPAPGQPFYGQDAQYVTNPMSYTVSPDGLTVTDNVTGLMWQRCVAGRSGEQCSAGTAQLMPWEVAVTYCQGLRLCGHTDWRLPDVFELQSIVDYGRSGIMIDLTMFPRTPNIFQWSSSTFPRDTRYAWGVEFGNFGRIITNYGMAGYSAGKASPAPVRCVRGESVPRWFTNHEDGTVSDNVTGLMWQQECDNVTRNWETALAYCEDLVLPPGGYSDWRLPDVKELTSIFDDKRYPMIDWAVFSCPIYPPYWTSTTRGTSDAYNVDFMSGDISWITKTWSSRRVLCVR